MCADPSTAKEIAAIKTEIQNLEERIHELERSVNGDGSKEKGIIPRLTTIETKTNLVLGAIGSLVLAVVPAVVKYLFS